MKSTHRRITGKDLPALRAKFNLTQLQLGALARASISTRTTPSGGTDRQCSIVQQWEAGTKPLPAPMAELIEAKLLLLELGHPVDHLIDTSLADILRDEYS